MVTLTESFSLLESELHNLPCWSPKQKWALSYAIPFYTMYTTTRLNRFSPASASFNQPERWVQNANCIAGNFHYRWSKVKADAILKTLDWGWCVVYKFEPVTYSPLLTKYRPQCSKIENNTNTHTTHLYFTDNFLCSLYLFSQSQQSLTKYNLFCFESPKLSLSFFNCSCSPMNVKMEQIGWVGPILGANVTLIEFFTR